MSLYILQALVLNINFIDKLWNLASQSCEYISNKPVNMAVHILSLKTNVFKYNIVREMYRCAQSRQEYNSISSQSLNIFKADVDSL